MLSENLSIIVFSGRLECWSRPKRERCLFVLPKGTTVTLLSPVVWTWHYPRKTSNDSVSVTSEDTSKQLDVYDCYGFTLLKVEPKIMGMGSKLPTTDLNSLSPLFFATRSLKFNFSCLAPPGGGKRGVCHHIRICSLHLASGSEEKSTTKTKCWEYIPCKISVTEPETTPSIMNNPST